MPAVRSVRRCSAAVAYGSNSVPRLRSTTTRLLERCCVITTRRDVAGSKPIGQAAGKLDAEVAARALDDPMCLREHLLTLALHHVEHAGIIRQGRRDAVVPKIRRRASERRCLQVAVFMLEVHIGRQQEGCVVGVTLVDASRTASQSARGRCGRRQQAFRWACHRCGWADCPGALA